MALFASTSPSWLILQSLDRCNRYLEAQLPDLLETAIPRIRQFKNQLSLLGYRLAGDEELKLTILPKSRGYRGDQLAQYLEERNIYPEFSDPDHLVCMLSPEDPVPQALLDALSQLPTRQPLTDVPPLRGTPRQVLSLHEALLAPAQTLPAEACLGRILACPTVSCPPAIPILVYGEQVDEESLALFAYYGHHQLTVVEDK